LQREKLLRGGEERLSLIVMFVATLFGLVAFMAWDIYALAGACFFAWPVQYLVRRLAKHDPQYLAVYLRAVKLPHKWEAH